MEVNSEVKTQLRKTCKYVYEEYVRIFEKYIDEIGYAGFCSLKDFINPYGYTIGNYNPYIFHLSKEKLLEDLKTNGLYFPFFITPYKFIEYSNKLVDGKVYLFEGRHRYELLKDEDKKFFTVFLKYGHDSTKKIFYGEEKMLSCIDNIHYEHFKKSGDNIILESVSEIFNLFLIYVRIFNKYSFHIKHKDNLDLKVDNELFNKKGRFGDLDVEGKRRIIIKCFKKYD